MVTSSSDSPSGCTFHRMPKREEDKPGWFGTQYELEGKTYGTCLWAESLEEAFGVASLRNIGETVSGYWFAPFELPSKLLRKRTVSLEALHGAVFVGWLASCAGVADSQQMLSDTGLIHEIIHYMQYGPINYPKKELINRMKALEEKVPGLVALR